VKLDIDNIKLLIKECVEEIKEVSEPTGIQSHRSHNLLTGDNENDPDMKAEKWRQFSEACCEPEFRDKFFLPTLKRRPDIVLSVLEFLNEEEELQNEFYKSIKSIREQDLA